MTDPAQAIADALAPHLPLRLGALKVWGDWFGRPYDNLHVVVAARVDSDGMLVLDFDQRECLRVVRPETWALDPESREPLRIERADRVEWGWFSSGRSRTPDNWFEERHWRDSDSIHASSTANWYVPRYAPTQTEPAVIFL